MLLSLLLYQTDLKTYLNSLGGGTVLSPLFPFSSVTFSASTFPFSTSSLKRDLSPLYQGQYFLGWLYSTKMFSWEGICKAEYLDGWAASPWTPPKRALLPPKEENFQPLLSRRKTRKAFPLEPIATAPYMVTEITPSIQGFGPWIHRASTAIQSFTWSRHVIVFSADAKLLISDCSGTPLAYAAENVVRWFFGITSISSASQYGVNWQRWIWDRPNNGLI